MAKKVVVRTLAEAAVERERRRQVLLDICRLSGLQLDDRPWRYDYSVDEVLAVAKATKERCR
jgi:hypothetical protein